MRSAALLAVILLCGLVGPAAGYEALWRDDRCSTQEPNAPPVHMSCAVKSSMSQGVQILTVTRPDGRIHQIENTEADIDRWFLDGRPARESVADRRSGICYIADQLQVCLGQYYQKH